MPNWLYVILGLHDANSAWYLFPSGWGSIIVPPILTAIPIVWVIWRKKLGSHTHYHYHYHSNGETIDASGETTEATGTPEGDR